MGGFITRYFSSEPPAPAQAAPYVWNAHISPADYEGQEDSYQAAMLDQYKLYAEMADRISARQSLATTFF